MSSAAEARGPAGAALPTDPAAAIPRVYNFAADILDRNLKAGRGGKPAFITRQPPTRVITRVDEPRFVEDLVGVLLA